MQKIVALITHSNYNNTPFRYSYTVVGVLVVVIISSYVFWIMAPKENRTYVTDFELQSNFTKYYILLTINIIEKVSGEVPLY